MSLEETRRSRKPVGSAVVIANDAPNVVQRFNDNLASSARAHAVASRTHQTFRTKREIVRYFTHFTRFSRFSFFSLRLSSLFSLRLSSLFSRLFHRFILFQQNEIMVFRQRFLR